jgi:NAD(P)-dependent dehydrogenase (short-subunit alcohol dehydrogenase family)
LFEHDLFGKPVSAFPDHALGVINKPAPQRGEKRQWRLSARIRSRSKASAFSLPAARAESARAQPRSAPASAPSSFWPMSATPVADKLRREGHQASAASCDVTNRAAVERLVSGAGALDALIVCSGICPFDDWMADDWDEVYERANAVNVKGTVNCVRAALPRMMERGDGRIVLVGSLAGRSGGLLSGPHYVASKGAVGALVRWFARKGAPRNVLVNGVAPGPVNTGMIAGRDLNLAAVPLGRIAQPEEIASTIAFLCSPAASYVCGVMLDVNGGVYMS